MTTDELYTPETVCKNSTATLAPVLITERLVIIRMSKPDEKWFFRLAEVQNSITVETKEERQFILNTINKQSYYN